MLNKSGVKLNSSDVQFAYKAECQLYGQQCLRKLNSTISQLAVMFIIVYDVKPKIWEYFCQVNKLLSDFRGLRHDVLSELLFGINIYTQPNQD